MSQLKLDEQIKQFYTGQALPMIQAQDLMRMIHGMPGGSTVSTSTGALPPGGNPIMGGLGGAASGAMMGNMVFPGAGGILGGILGGGMGYFGSR